VIVPGAVRADVSVIVPVELAPPGTELGLIASEILGTGKTVRVAVELLGPAVAVIVALAGFWVAPVPIEKVVEFDPAGITTVDGTTTRLLLLASATVVPPYGARLPSVTVPVEPFPASTVLGLSVTLTVGSNS
jgi:hypothetical protein